MIHVTDPYPPVTRYSPAFTANGGGLTFTGTGTTYPTYNSYYVKHGQMVSFWIKIDLNTVTNFGTTQLKTELPFAPYDAIMNHFPGWIWYDPSVPADISNHIILNVDTLAGSKTLDLHWLDADPAIPKPVREQLLTPTSPFTLTTSSKIYINGTYISAE